MKKPTLLDLARSQYRKPALRSDEQHREILEREAFAIAEMLADLGHDIKATDITAAQDRRADWDAIGEALGMPPDRSPGINATAAAIVSAGAKRRNELHVTDAKGAPVPVDARGQPLDPRDPKQAAAIAILDAGKRSRGEIV